MSDYMQITRHPHTKKYSAAKWMDDYFGPHLYGVQFQGVDDDKVYPAEQIQRAQLKEFWATDVVQALRESAVTQLTDVQIVEFLNDLDSVYRDRWARDPHGGEGALEEYTRKGWLPEDLPRLEYNPCLPKRNENTDDKED